MDMNEETYKRVSKEIVREIENIPLEINTDISEDVLDILLRDALQVYSGDNLGTNILEYINYNSRRDILQLGDLINQELSNDSKELEDASTMLEPKHLIHAGMYCRSARIPKGTLFTGCQIKKGTISVIYGDILVGTEEGLVRLTGFNVVPAVSGRMRVGYAYADTYWATLNTTNAKSIPEVEKEMTDDELLSNR